MSNRSFENGNTALNKLIDDFGVLSLDEKEYALDVVKKRLTEEKRQALAKRAKDAMVNLKKKRVKKGTIKDLYRDLESA